MYVCVHVCDGVCMYLRVCVCVCVCECDGGEKGEGGGEGLGCERRRVVYVCVW